MPKKNTYYLTDIDIRELREFFDSFQAMVFELIESRRIKVSSKRDWPERQYYASVYEKLDNLAQEKFDF